MEITLLSLDKAISDCVMIITDFNPKTNPMIVGALKNLTRSCTFLLDASNRAFIGQIAYILTGSVAELTIKTPLYCFGDSDFMMRFKGVMVTPLSSVVPGKEFMRKFEHERIALFGYFQTEYPGFVRLYRVGTQSFDDETDSFQLVPQKPFIPADWSLIVKTGCKPQSKNHGPAIQWKSRGFGIRFGYHEAYSTRKVDVVPCLFCPHWPPEARDFYERSRPHGWPTRSKIEEIVSGGCDFVQVCHPFYEKQDVKPHWRFSFSRAEIILVHTWSNSQKIVYHLLRYLNKNTKMFEDQVICTYHLKTLMLWNCEKRPPEYWNCQHLMHIVADMLLELKHCVQAKQLQNYFIPDCNLMLDSCRELDDDDLHNTDGTEFSSERLSSFKVSDLIDWFLRNYLFVLAAKCPKNHSEMMILDVQRTNSLTNDKIWIQKFTEVLQSDYVRANEKYKDLGSCMWMIFYVCQDLERNNRSCRYPLRLLHQADGRLINYFCGCLLLSVAQHIQESNQTPGYRLIGMLLDVVTDFNDTDDCSWEFSTNDDSDDIAELYFSRSLLILHSMANKKESDAFELLLEVAKFCLRKSLECSGSSPISSAAVVYLAMISYKQRFYEETIDLCMLVIECPCIPRTYGINRDLVKAFDLPHLSALIGFADLAFHHRNVINRAVETHAIEYDPWIIASMLLKDVFDCCGSSASIAESLENKLTDWYKRLINGGESHVNAKQSERNTIHGYGNRIILDIIVMSVKKKISYFRRKSKQTKVIYSRRSLQYLPKISDNLFNSLLDLSTRYLTAFHRSVKDDLDPWKYRVITDQYLALNSFRSGDYVTALELSDQMLECCAQSNMKPSVRHFIYHVIVDPPPFLLLFDDQLKMLVNEFPDGQQYFDTGVLALYLKTECLLKLDKTVNHFCEPVSQLNWYCKYKRDEISLISEKICCYQLNKLLRVLNGRLQVLPDGRILWSHKVNVTLLNYSEVDPNKMRLNKHVLKHKPDE